MMIEDLVICTLEDFRPQVHGEQALPAYIRHLAQQWALRLDAVGPGWQPYVLNGIFYAAYYYNDGNDDRARWLYWKAVEIPNSGTGMTWDWEELESIPLEAARWMP